MDSFNLMLECRKYHKREKGERKEGGREREREREYIKEDNVGQL